MLVEIPYTPRAHGRTLHRLIESNRAVVACWHRRAGKTVASINALIKLIVTCPLPNARGLYVAPFRNQAKRVAWKYFVDFTKDIPGIRHNITELSITFPNGGMIMLGGADSPDTYRGQYFDGVILDEFAQFPPRLWTQVIRPALADRKGKMICIGTPAGRNGFYRLFNQAAELPDWANDYLPVQDTDVIDPDELAAIRREMPRNEFEQEFELSWTAAITGALFGAEMSQADRDGRITTVPADAALPVHCSWDLGIRDSAVWLYQLCGMEVRLLECRLYTGSSLVEIIGDLEKLGYTYGTDLMPHDARLREFSTGVTRVQTMQNLMRDPVVCRNIPVSDGIEAARNMLSRCWFDAEKCREGIEALIQYRTEFDDLKRSFSLKPVHDWCSHPADAFRYIAVESAQGQSSFEWGGALPWDKADDNPRGTYRRAG